MATTRHACRSRTRGHSGGRLTLVVLAGVMSAVPAPGASADVKWSGWAAIEARVFPRSPLSDVQHGDNLSVAAKPEFYADWDDGRQSLTVRAFGRLDQNDAKRTHADLRELMWVRSAGTWELRLGVGKVYWGVTESVHLVDVVNSTDQVESPDGEEKLGQPMVNLTLLPAAGTIDLFLLPGFRPPTFAGEKGRLRTPLPVDREAAEFESADDERHVGWAVRWSNTLGPVDAGVSHFSGTSRTPRFRSETNTAGNDVLIPVYDLVEQTGIDLQTTLGGWLWKLELVSAEARGSRHTGLAAGYEYTFGAVFNTGADLGVLTEYLMDDRGKSSGNPFENDVFVGARLALNNVSGTDVLGGVIVDLDNQTNAVFVEGSTRLTNGLTLEVEVRASAGADERDPLYGFRRDAYVQTTLTGYF